MEAREVAEQDVSPRDDIDLTIESEQDEQDEPNEIDPMQYDDADEFMHDLEELSRVRLAKLGTARQRANNAKKDPIIDTYVPQQLKQYAQRMLKELHQSSKQFKHNHEYNDALQTLERLVTKAEAW